MAAGRGRAVDTGGAIADFRRRFRTAQVTRRQLRRVMEQTPRLRIVAAQPGCGDYDVTVRREDTGYTLLIPPYAPDRSAWSAMKTRSAAYLCWLAQAGSQVREISGEVSDGSALSGATYCFSSYGARIALPDYYFFRSRGFAAFRKEAAAAAEPWERRNDEIIWRGGPNGLGMPALGPDLDRHPALVQRVAMAQRCQGSRVDFRFVGAGTAGDTEMFRRGGLIGAPVPALSWGGRRYAIDIDGNGNAWDNFFHRLLLGCCVIKIESHFGYRQWYYDRLRPGEHFIPVRRDLSNLEEQVDWALTNQDRAREIAAAGQAVALEATWERECRRAGQIIEQTEAARGS